MPFPQAVTVTNALFTGNQPRIVAEPRMIDLATLESSALTPLVGQSMTIRSGDQSALLEVTEVRVLGNKRPGAPRDPFTIAFRGQPGLRAPQGIYRLEHPSIDAMEIFMTQTGDGPKGSEFEAVFT